MQLFKENTATMVTPLIRYALIAVAGGLISKGYITAEQIDIIAGGIVSLATVAWLAIVKNKQN